MHLAVCLPNMSLPHVMHAGCILCACRTYAESSGSAILRKTLVQQQALHSQSVWPLVSGVMHVPNNIAAAARLPCLQGPEGTDCIHQPNKAHHTPVQAVCQSQAGTTDAVDLLSSQYFFTSPKLANLATEAEILAQVLLFYTLQFTCHQP